MKPAGLVLAAAFLASLALVACGDGRSGKDEGPSHHAPLGFELALVKVRDTVSGDEDVVPADPTNSPAAVIDLSPQDLAGKLATGKVRLIDVRTDAEVAEGVIAGAEHIPLDRFDPAALDLSDGREVVLYCRSGRRSAIAGERLAAAIGAPAQHLSGGILAWEEAGQPIAPR